MKYSQKIRSNVEESLGVFVDGVGTQSPVYTVCTITPSGNRGAIIHQCGGRWGKENAMKRFRWLAYAKPYRDWQSPNLSDASLRRLYLALQDTY